MNIKIAYNFKLISLNILIILCAFASCTIPKQYQKDKPYITKNYFEVKGGNFNKDEIIALKTRLESQLDDSAKVNIVDKFFIGHIYNNPPAFDTSYVIQSAKNMQSSMPHIGYYRAKVNYKILDTINKHKPVFSLRFKAGKFPIWIRKEKRVAVKYTVDVNNPTTIDTITYNLKNEDLQNLTNNNLENSFLHKGSAVTKAAIQSEIARLVNIYKNNGYYKFSSDELRVRGDTTVEALTNISDDIFDQTRLIEEAQQKKKFPKIKLAIQINKNADPKKIKKYYINNVYIFPDYKLNDKLTDSIITERVTKTDKYILRYHNKIFRTGFITRHLFIKKGDLYNQEKFYKTLNSLSKVGVWQSSNIEIVEDKDSSNKINLIVQLMPSKQFSFETSAEASYSSTSNSNNITSSSNGNLLGLLGNISLTNKNIGKEGITMTTALRTGVELNLKNDSTKTGNILNSKELSLSTNIVFPRFIFPFKIFNKNKHIENAETFITPSVSLINRVNLFSLQTTNLGFGYSFKNKKGNQFVFKPINIEFANLYNPSANFLATLESNPFLRYSFNTALVAGSSINYSTTYINPKNNGFQHTFKANFEESGFPVYGLIPLRKLNLFTLNLRQFGKIDIEYSVTNNKPKSAIAFRTFAGFGISSNQKNDSTLPFFKQYYVGGSNSMRGWPVRGVGIGAQPLAPYGYTKFNDRTGDIKFETNVEFRHNITQLIPNIMSLKGAFFIDAGNIWNLKSAKPFGAVDSAQFKFKNFANQIGIDAGYGFRLDINYVVLRFDFGFRIKRPETSFINNGWQIPSLSFNDVFKKIFTKGNDDFYRKWRYENFNFTFGIGYPF